MISETSIQQVFEAADIVRTIQSCGIELKKTGSNYSALSPFKAEKTASFMVSPSKQIFKCFGSGIGGNALKFVMVYKQLSFPEAIEFLAGEFGVVLEYDKKEVSEEKQDQLERMGKVVEYSRIRWRRALKELGPDSEEMLYLTQKRMLNIGTIDEWEIGFAPDSWDFLKRDIIDKGYFSEAKQVGVISERQGKAFDMFRGRFMFPIRNHLGKLVGFGGRDFSGEQKAKYLNSLESDLYDKSKVLYGLNMAQQAIRNTGYVYLTEGYLDVISLHQSGVENVVATCGTGLTKSHAKLLSRYTKRVRLLYDGDTAGIKAAKRAIPILIKEGFRVEFTQLDQGEDPDDLCKKFMSYEEEESQVEATV